MTKNKRYTSDIHRIYDNNEEIACADTMDDAEIIVDRLNEQRERINELEIENKRLKEKNNKLYKFIEDKINEVEEDLKRAVKAGMGTVTCYSDLDLLEEIKEILE